MDIERARYLVSPRGRAALEALAANPHPLEPNRLATYLRKSHPPAESADLAEQLTLRARASPRFGPDHPPMLYTASGLEMMTHPVVSARRAKRLVSLGFPVADATCGIGGDLRAAADAGIDALGIEHDQATAVIARSNVPAARIVRGDASSLPIDPSRFALIIDPARRTAVGRRFDPAAFSPPWDDCVELLRRGAAGILKAPPGLGHENVPLWAELEAVQLGRDLRELSLWAGAGAEPGLRRAVLLPEGAELDSRAAQSEGLATAPGRYLFDPESCVTRSGLVRHLAAALNANLMDEQVAYLTSGSPEFHTMAATFEVLEALPFSIQRLKELLRARNWRPDEIRRRAFPVEPDELRRLLGKLQGERVTLLCTTLRGARLVFIARRLYPPAAPGA